MPCLDLLKEPQHFRSLNFSSTHTYMNSPSNKITLVSGPMGEDDDVEQLDLSFAESAGKSGNYYRRVVKFRVPVNKMTVYWNGEGCYKYEIVVKVDIDAVQFMYRNEEGEFVEVTHPDFPGDIPSFIARSYLKDDTFIDHGVFVLSESTTPGNLSDVMKEITNNGGKVVTVGSGGIDNLYALDAVTGVGLDPRKYYEYWYELGKKMNNRGDKAIKVSYGGARKDSYLEFDVNTREPKLPGEPSVKHQVPEPEKPVSIVTLPKVHKPAVAEKKAQAITESVCEKETAEEPAVMVVSPRPRKVEMMEEKAQPTKELIHDDKPVEKRLEIAKETEFVKLMNSRATKEQEKTEWRKIQLEKMVIEGKTWPESTRNGLAPNAVDEGPQLPTTVTENSCEVESSVASTSSRKSPSPSPSEESGKATPSVVNSDKENNIQSEKKIVKFTDFRNPNDKSVQPGKSCLKTPSPEGTPAQSSPSSSGSNSKKLVTWMEEATTYKERRFYSGRQLSDKKVTESREAIIARDFPTAGYFLPWRVQLWEEYGIDPPLTREEERHLREKAKWKRRLGRDTGAGATGSGEVAGAESGEGVDAGGEAQVIAIGEKKFEECSEAGETKAGFVGEKGGQNPTASGEKQQDTVEKHDFHSASSATGSALIDMRSEALLAAVSAGSVDKTMALKVAMKTTLPQANNFQATLSPKPMTWAQVAMVAPNKRASSTTILSSPPASTGNKPMTTLSRRSSSSTRSDQSSLNGIDKVNPLLVQTVKTVTKNQEKSTADKKTIGSEDTRLVTEEVKKPSGVAKGAAKEEKEGELASQPKEEVTLKGTVKEVAQVQNPLHEKESNVGQGEAPTFLAENNCGVVNSNEKEFFKGDTERRQPFQKIEEVQDAITQGKVPTDDGNNEKSTEITIEAAITTVTNTSSSNDLVSPISVGEKSSNEKASLTLTNGNDDNAVVVASSVSKGENAAPDSAVPIGGNAKNKKKKKKSKAKKKNESKKQETTNDLNPQEEDVELPTPPASKPASPPNSEFRHSIYVDEVTDVFNLVDHTCDLDNRSATSSQHSETNSSNSAKENAFHANFNGEGQEGKSKGKSKGKIKGKGKGMGNAILGPASEIKFEEPEPLPKQLESATGYKFPLDYEGPEDLVTCEGRTAYAIRLINDLVAEMREEKRNIAERVKNRI
ncbi:hypothetical protein ABW20_dc0106693 [Dactylellina cionopaga]|nr:hypothetical protein ABW20_dc0106693 [Dactylellina cionopaga]